MTSYTDQSQALTALLDILAQSTRPRTSNSIQPQTHPIETPQRYDLQDDASINDNSDSIGESRVPWREPRPWNLRPRPYNPAIPCVSPPKRKRSLSPQPDCFDSYSSALNYLVRKSQSGDFLQRMRKIKRKQDELETELWEERGRIPKKFESQRKLNALLQSIRSQSVSEDVHFPFERCSNHRRC
jgi:hypothetical protein